MSSFTKRFGIIPSCRVDRDLILELGEALEKNPSIGPFLHYYLESHEKEIVSQTVKNFVKTDWGSNINIIRIETQGQRQEVEKQPELEIKIIINFGREEFEEWKFWEYDGSGSFYVSGNSEHQVATLAKEIEEIFDNHRSRLYQIKENLKLRLVLTIFTSTTIIPPFLLVWKRLVWDQVAGILLGDRSPLFLTEAMFLLVSVCFIIVIAIVIFASDYYILKWAFPYFEYEPTFMRKCLWLILHMLGLIFTVILIVLNF